MRFWTRERFSAARLASALIAFLCSIAYTHITIAAPAVITGNPVRAQIPDFNEPITINWRQLGVISGSAPLVISSSQLQFRRNNEPTNLVEVSFPPNNGPGRVCVTLRNVDFTRQPGDVYTLHFAVTN